MHRYSFKFSLLLVAALFGAFRSGLAQDSKKSKDSEKGAAVKALIDEPRYVFKVQSVTPMKGGMRQLTPGYTLKVSKDTVSAELPYFGRLYQATPGSSEGGIKFTSTSFDYNTKPRKKGGWDIVIKPKDGGYVQEMYLTVFENGSASLDVNCRDRQPISYNGDVDTLKSK